MIDKQIFIRYCEPKRKSIMEAVRTEKTRMIAPAAGVEWNTYSMSFTDTEGYQLREVLKISPWISPSKKILSKARMNRQYMNQYKKLNLLNLRCPTKPSLWMNLW